MAAIKRLVIIIVSLLRGIMRLYYFHLVSREEFIRDYQGKDFSDLVGAYRHARSLIHKAVTWDFEWRGWSIRIVDVNGRSTLSVLFPQPSHHATRIRAVLESAGTT